MTAFRHTTLVGEHVLQYGVGVLARQHPVAAGDEGDLDAHCRLGRDELRTGDTGADDDEVLGKLGQIVDLSPRPLERLGTDRAGMTALPPIAPAVGAWIPVRFSRDYYVRIAGNDYSVDPTVIGHFVDVHADLTRVTVTCLTQLIGTHQRCWASRQTITDPAHVFTAAELRRSYKSRARPSGARVRAGTVVGLRALSDYDELFALAPTGSDTAADPAPVPVTSTPPTLEIVR